MAEASRYPDLDDFLSSEWIQDSTDRRSIEERVQDFADTREPVEPGRVAADARRFLHDRHNDVDEAFKTIFRPQVRPLGYGLTTAEFLERIASLMDAA